MFIEYVVQGADYTRSHLYYNELINLAFLDVTLFNVSGVRLARAGGDSIWARAPGTDEIAASLVTKYRIELFMSHIC